MVIVAPVTGASITAPFRLVAETEAPEPPPPPLQDASEARIRKNGIDVLTVLTKKAEKSLELSMGFPLKKCFYFAMRCSPVREISTGHIIVLKVSCGVNQCGMDVTEITLLKAMFDESILE
jgi:hypothetical protein